MGCLITFCLSKIAEYYFVDFFLNIQQSESLL